MGTQQSWFRLNPTLAFFLGFKTQSLIPRRHVLEFTFSACRSMFCDALRLELNGVAMDSPIASTASDALLEGGRDLRYRKT